MTTRAHTQIDPGSPPPTPPRRPTPTRSGRRSRALRALVVAAGVAAVPAGVAVAASLADGGSTARSTFGSRGGLDDGIGSSTSSPSTTDSSPSSSSPTSSVPTSSSSPSASSPTSSPPTSSPSTSSPSSTAPARAAPASGPLTPVTRTFSSSGGSVVVALSVSGSLTLVASTPAPGYAAEVHDARGDRVELRFRGGSSEWRIRVEVRDGRPEAEITGH